MKRRMKNGIAMLFGTMALTAVAGLALAAETRFAVQDSTGTLDKMVVQDTGYIGVGTNAPFSAINLVGPINAAAQVLAHTNFTGNLGGGSFVGLHNNANGALPVAGDRLGYFYFGTKSGTNYRLGGGMAVTAEGAWTDTSWPTAFKFETAAATGGRIERMRVSSNGNIGIGTDSPKQILEVNGGIRINNVTNSFRSQASQPLCNDTTGPTTDGGLLWFTRGAAGVKDKLEVCAKDATNHYSWVTIN